MFYGLATKKVRSPKVTFRHVLEDIETLNRKAMEGHYDLSAISYHAYPYVADKYVLDGQRIEHRRRLRPDDHRQPSHGPRGIEGQAHRGPRHPDHGLPGLQAVSSRISRPVVTPFDKITDAVKERSVDAGLIIHEAQLTFDREGFHRIVDLGRWFKTTHGLPLPLGGNVLLRSLGPDIQSECCRMMRESIQYALDNHDEALEYAMQFARDMEPRLAEKFVGMYVNHYTRGCRRRDSQGRAEAARYGLRSRPDHQARGSGIRPLSSVPDAGLCAAVA